MLIESGVLQNTELKFDLVSPVNELAKQIRMEFDFLHEAETMDAVGEHLMVSLGSFHVAILRSAAMRAYRMAAIICSCMEHQCSLFGYLRYTACTARGRIDCVGRC